MRKGLEGLYRLQKDDAERAARMLSRAFHDDPLSRFAFPDGAQDNEILFSFFLTPVKYCLKYGEGYAPTSDIEGVALWLPSDKFPMSFWRVLRATSLWSMFMMMFKIGFGRMKRMAHVGKHLDEAHMRLAPFEHPYLVVLGVDPEHQGKGYAGKLLRPMMAWFDEEGMPCYLDTLSEKNVGMYEHFGFRLLERSGIPETDIMSWALLRELR